MSPFRCFFSRGFFALLPCVSLQISCNLVSNVYPVPGFPTNQETVRSKVSSDMIAVASFTGVVVGTWRDLGRLYQIAKCKERLVSACQSLPSSLSQRRAAGGGTLWPQRLPWGPQAPPCFTPIGLGRPRPQSPFPAPGLLGYPE